MKDGLTNVRENQLGFVLTAAALWWTCRFKVNDRKKGLVVYSTHEWSFGRGGLHTSYCTLVTGKSINCPNDCHQIVLKKTQEFTVSKWYWILKGSYFNFKQSRGYILPFYHHFLTIMKEIQTQLAQRIWSIKKVTYIMERTPGDVHCRVTSRQNGTDERQERIRSLADIKKKK